VDPEEEGPEEGFGEVKLKGEEVDHPGAGGETNGYVVEDEEGAELKEDGYCL